MLTFVQIIVITALVSLVVGFIIGWKVTSSFRLAKIQEQQYEINKIKDKNANERGKLIEKYEKEINKLKKENSEYRSELRSYKFSEGKEKVGSAVAGTGKAISQFAGGVKKKFWSKKDKKDEQIKLMALPEESESGKETGE